MELSNGACSSDRGAAQAREVVAIGAAHAFDQAEQSQTFELARQGGRTQRRYEYFEIGATHTMNVGELKLD